MTCKVGPMSAAGRLVVLACLLVLAASHELQGAKPVDARQIDENLRRLRQMSDAEKTEFLRKKRRFDELSEAEKQHLRHVYAELQSRPDAEHLMNVLRRYSEWLKTLPPGERAQLLSLPAEKRVARIKEILRTREAARFKMMVDGRLSREDLQVIRKWLDQYIREHQSELLQQLPKSWKLSATDHSPRRRRALIFALLRSPKLVLDASSQKKLVEQMSREAQQFLSKLETEEERSRVLRNWIHAAVLTQARPTVGRDQLRKFLRERVSPHQREYLESLAPEAMYRELQRLYYRDLGRRGSRRWWPPRGKQPSNSPKSGSKAPTNTPPVKKQPSSDKPTG